MASQEDNVKILELLKQEEVVCRIEKEAYQRWVNLITIVRLVMICGAILLACAALGTIIKPIDYITTQDTVVAVSCSFMAVIFASLHIALDMDKRHNEARRIRTEYAMLETQCGKTQALAYHTMWQVYDEVEHKQKQIAAGAKSKPPQWLRQQVQLIERKFS